MGKYHYQTCGLDDVYLLNGYEVIEYGGEKAVSIHDLDGLHRLIGCTLAKQDSRLSGKAFRFLRLEMNQSQKSIGVLFGVNEQTVANWEKKNNVPQMADALIRSIYIESLGDDSKVRALLDLLASVDRATHRQEILFEKSDGNWVLQAA